MQGDEEVVEEGSPVAAQPWVPRTGQSLQAFTSNQILSPIPFLFLLKMSIARTTTGFIDQTKTLLRVRGD